MRRKRKSFSAGGYDKSRLAEMRKKLSPFQRELLNEFWQDYRKTGKWPSARTVHSQRGKQTVKESLQSLGGDVVSEGRDSSGDRHYELTAIGVLLTDAGQEYFDLLTRYLEFLRKQYKEVPEQLSFSDKDFRQAFGLSDDQAKILGELVRMARLWGSGSYGADSWTVHVPDEVEDFPEEGPLNQTLESLLFRWFQTSRPISYENRQKQIPATALFDPLKVDAVAASTELPFAVDALKRRYQVFVSSTYEDLKEERQHVIQALLETKCIPLGMELFPAASVEQWELIKRVIMECDYYMVIVAGRYGSLNISGVGYTEMEFEYAVNIGKPIIGFYHKNPDSLPGAKLEKSDASRERLKAFTEKIKMKLCRPWSSAAELGSAVKSAILHELEFNPKPGWIRADAVPSSEAVEKLKQRIADLEEKLKKRKSSGTQQFPGGNEKVRIPVVVEHNFKDDPKQPWERTAQQQFEHEFETTWDDLILLFRNELQDGCDSQMLQNTLRRRIEETILPIAVQRIGVADPEFRCSISSARFDIILKTFMARKLVRMLTGVYGSWSDPRWMFTPGGVQYLAELQAARSETGD